jgi:hypothetical protein
LVRTGYGHDMDVSAGELILVVEDLAAAAEMILDLESR